MTCVHARKPKQTLFSFYVLGARSSMPFVCGVQELTTVMYLTGAAMVSGPAMHLMLDSRGIYIIIRHIMHFCSQPRRQIVPRTAPHSQIARTASTLRT